MVAPAMATPSPTLSPFLSPRLVLVPLSSRPVTDVAATDEDLRNVLLSGVGIVVGVEGGAGLAVDDNDAPRAALASSRGRSTGSRVNRGLLSSHVALSERRLNQQGSGDMKSSGSSPELFTGAGSILHSGYRREGVAGQ